MTSHPQGMRREVAIVPPTLEYLRGNIQRTAEHVFVSKFRWLLSLVKALPLALSHLVSKMFKRKLIQLHICNRNKKNLQISLPYNQTTPALSSDTTILLHVIAFQALKSVIIDQRTISYAHKKNVNKMEKAGQLYC